MAGNSFLLNRQALIVTCLLVVACAVFYGLPKERPVDLLFPLAQLPASLNGWTMVSETPTEKEVLDVLKADDTLSRVYVRGATQDGVNLFIAYFRSQATGVSPHSPKNCLPGSGWAVSKSDTLEIPVPDLAAPIRVNRYIVSKGDTKSLVLYWYQSHSRAVATEYAAKVYLVLDAIRYRRSDTSIVRVTTPVRLDREEAAQQAAVDFVKASFSTIDGMLPH